MSELIIDWTTLKNGLLFKLNERTTEKIIQIINTKNINLFNKPELIRPLMNEYCVQRRVDMNRLIYYINMDVTHIVPKNYYTCYILYKEFRRGINKRYIKQIILDCGL